jgi:ApbE superfamily uncharacterized protein (UPF0280 family)
MYEPRFYRGWIQNSGLITYEVLLKESDLHIGTVTDLSREAKQLVKKYRGLLEDYIRRQPAFAASLLPVPIETDAPAIVQEMARASQLADVGPMAAVAGAISQFVGEDLAVLSPEVIIENGGDIYLRSTRPRVIAIYAGSSPLSGRIGLEIQPEDMPLGICTSSATVGPSLSFGHADAAVAVASSAILADAAATAIGNAVITPEDVDTGLKVAQSISGLRGAVVVIGDRIGAWGRIKLCRVDTASSNVWWHVS